MDQFAQIAKTGVNTGAAGLEAPQPSSPPGRVARLAARENDVPRALPAQDETPEGLAAELSRLREAYAPFLQNYAPALPATRTRIPLQHFECHDPQTGETRQVETPHYGGPLGNARLHYQTTFTLPEHSGKAVFACFEGADYLAHIYVNGVFVGQHEGFFAAFEFDITHCVQAGENTLRVELHNDYVYMGSRDEAGKVFCGDKLYAATGPGYDDPVLGWHHCPPGMGLYAPVAVEVRNRLFVSDLFVRTQTAEIEVWAEVENRDYQPANVELAVDIFGRNFPEEALKDLRVCPAIQKQIGRGDTLTQIRSLQDGSLDAALPLAAGKGKSLYKIPISLATPHIWEPDTPYLYQLQLRLLDEDGSLLDAAETQFGVRSFVQDTQDTPKGMFYLNGQKTRLRGANTMGFEQQDVLRGDTQQLIDDILLAKLCNMNFLRLTQRPVQRQVYEMCDRLGMMTQTDLPLFGCVRRERLCEVIRQAEEMERHVRRHPCNILVSYINEPFPAGQNRPHSNLTRPELLSLFTAMDEVVRLANPDRVIKAVDGDYDPPAPGLPDNHCYTLWYNGHGIDTGRLLAGHWMEVKPGWYYGCGEFGAEGLDGADLMRRRYPAEWLPKPGEEADWTPTRISAAQTGDFYKYFFDKPTGLEQWIQASQRHQAQATTLMTEAFRRDPGIVSFAIHLFIDAFPAGWMKTIMDCERRPKPAYWAYRRALQPLMVSWQCGKQRYYGGETLQAACHICNDSPRAGEGILRTELLQNGRLVAAEEHPAAIGAATAGADCLVQYALPAVESQTVFVLRAVLEVPGQPAVWNTLEIEVFPALVHLPENLLFARADEWSAALEQQVRSGAVLVVEMPAQGSVSFAGITAENRPSDMGPLHFAARNTGHPCMQGFAEKDFRLWYDEEASLIAPLAAGYFTGGQLTPLLVCGDAKAPQPDMVMGECALGTGRVVASQIPTRRLLASPVGRLLLARLAKR